MVAHGVHSPFLGWVISILVQIQGCSCGSSTGGQWQEAGRIWNKGWKSRTMNVLPLADWYKQWCGTGEVVIVWPFSSRTPFCDYMETRWLPLMQSTWVYVNSSCATGICIDVLSSPNWISSYNLYTLHAVMYLYTQRLLHFSFWIQNNIQTLIWRFLAD